MGCSVEELDLRRWPARDALEAIGADRLVAEQHRRRAVCLAAFRRRGRRAARDLGVSAGSRERHRHLRRAHAPRDGVLHFAHRAVSLREARRRAGRRDGRRHGARERHLLRRGGR